MRLNACWAVGGHVAAALLLCAAWPAICFAQSRPGPFDAAGVIEAEGGVLSIGTAATGVIERIAREPGERVHAGEELIKVDCAPLEASTKSLAGQAVAARANADRVRNGPRPEEIAVGEANVGVARARAEEAADALQRAQRLQVGISVTQASLFQTERAARITQAQLADALARLELLRSGSRKEDIVEADARRDAAEAAFLEAKARLEQCTVHSPIEGVVVARLASQGQFVSAAVPQILLEIVNDRSFAVLASVDAAHFGDLCLAQHASVSLPGAQPMTATVERIAPQTMAARIGSAGKRAGADGELAVRLKLDSQRAGLFAGEPVSVHFAPCRG